MQIKYDTHVVVTTVGDLKVSLCVLKDLDKTIDHICDEIERLGLQDSKDPLAVDLCPYFGVLWASSPALSEYLFEIKSDIKGKRILELGCGLALPSLVAKKLGATVVASDFHPEVYSFLKKSFELNQVQFDFVNFNWRQERKDLGRFDYVIGSDILYENTHPLEIAQSLINYTHPDGAILIADPGRSYLQKFVSSMNESGFKEEIILREVFGHHNEIGHIGDKGQEVFILKFVKK